MRKYPSDLTNRQWQVIKIMLPHSERKRKHSLRAIWNGLLYLIRTGCQWRMLPKCFPAWQTVYYHYSRWRDMDIEDVVYRLRELARRKQGKNAGASAGIIDSQSVKSGLPNAIKGFDGKKRSTGERST